MSHEDESAQAPDALPQSEASALVLDSDLFFMVKVSETLARAGYRVRKARNLAEFEAGLREARPTIALVNLAARGVDAVSAIARAREADVPVIAYGPHVDIAGQAAARAAGATTVIANSKLASDLPGVVARTLRRGGEV